MIGFGTLRDWNIWLLGLWLAALVLLFCKPPNTPPSAPAGCGIVNGFPVYAYPQVSYEERFSEEALGPEPVPTHSAYCQCVDCYPYVSPLGDHAYFEARSLGCDVSRAAVKAQGVGE